MKNDLVELDSRASELCEQIEKLPAHPQQTRVSLLATELLAALRRYVGFLRATQSEPITCEAEPLRQIEQAAARLHPKPSIGRVVHFVHHKEQHWAAIITAMKGDYALLHVFPPAQSSFPLRALYSEAMEPETWHWPEREDLR